MPDFDFFKAAGQRYRPRGSTVSHPAAWKGRIDKVSDADTLLLRKKDFAAPVIVKMPDGSVRRRQMTQQQKATAEYLLKGYSRRQAMLKAGYTDMMVKKHNTRKYNRTVISFVETMQDKLMAAGISNDKLSEKLAEWLEAKKTVSARVTNRDADVDTDDFIDVPDYKTQLEAYDRIEKIVNPVNKSKEESGMKRQVSFTEWINGDKTVTQEQQEDA